ncbi:MAG: hypothetical protein ACRDH8_14235 [Actinomycetota bacterium]|jgi:uncharacterized membrane protein YqjE
MRERLYETAPFAFLQVMMGLLALSAFVMGVAVLVQDDMIFWLAGVPGVVVLVILGVVGRFYRKKPTDA